MSECLFCLIAEGRLNSTKIYENDSVYAFLDLYPANEGHTLIIPKKHAKNILDADPAIGHDVFVAMQKVTDAVRKATGAPGVNIVQNNGRAAGQMVDHLHWHVIPRFDGDGFKLWPQKKYSSPADMEAMAEEIRKELN